MQIVGKKNPETFQLLWSTRAQKERLCKECTVFPSNIVTVPTACPLTWHSKVPLWIISAKAQQGAVTVRHPYSHTAGPLSATSCLQLIYMQKRARTRRQKTIQEEIRPLMNYFNEYLAKVTVKKQKNMIKGSLCFFWSSHSLSQTTPTYKIVPLLFSVPL